jgi:hypothetical protein
MNEESRKCVCGEEMELRGSLVNEMTMVWGSFRQSEDLRNWAPL